MTTKALDKTTEAAPVAKKKAPARFTATNVETLPAGEYTDPSTTGLQLRVREGATKSTRTWLLRYKWRGQSLRIVLGHLPLMSLANAREKAQRMRRALDDGIDPRRAEPRRTATPAPLPAGAATSTPTDRHSIEFLASEFVARHVQPRSKRPEYVRGILERDILPIWKGRDARTIKPREVIELLDGIVARGSLVMANRTAAVLTQLFKFGIHRTIVEASPVVLLYRPGGKEKPRERALSDKELCAFFNTPRITKTERLRAAMTILLLTGQRRGELGAARWHDIDFKARTWTVPPEHSKTGKGHVVPLAPWTCEEFRLLQRLAKRSAYVLPAADGKDAADSKLLTRGLARCQKRFKEAGIAPFTLHDLRRTCRTGLARLKVEPHIAERVLNHAQEKIAGTYDTHDYMDEKRAALNKWAEYLEGLRP